MTVKREFPRTESNNLKLSAFLRPSIFVFVFHGQLYGTVWRLTVKLQPVGILVYQKRAVHAGAEYHGLFFGVNPERIIAVKTVAAAFIAKTPLVLLVPQRYVIR